jgi:deoxyribodipyrimidine photo-lyase
MSVIEKEHAHLLNNCGMRKGNYVLYWMQQSQRADDNHALAFAIETANNLNLPVLVYFGLTDNFPEANLRHYSFMLDGLEEVEDDLKKLSIPLKQPLIIWFI